MIYATIKTTAKNAKSLSEESPFLTRSEEAQLLQNLLSDPEDSISARILDLHYQTTSEKTQ